MARHGSFNEKKPAQKEAAREFPRELSHWTTLWHPAVVMALLVGCAFAPILWNQFVGWDDYDNLVNNPAYRGLGWDQLCWMFTTFHLGHYQPLSWVTFAIDYLVWGLNPVGYHLTNLILHVANAVFFYFVGRRLLLSALAPTDSESAAQINLSAAFAALLFALHPLRVESVAWATERRDVLSGFFFFATIYCYLRAAETSHPDSGRFWLYAAVVVYGLSLLSKAIAMTLPVVLLLLDIYPLRRYREHRAVGSSRSFSRFCARSCRFLAWRCFLP